MPRLNTHAPARRALAAGLALLCGACSSDSASTGPGTSTQRTIRPELVRVETPASPAVVRSNVGASTAGPHWSSNVSITSFRVPIRQISLHDSSFSTEADIYHCAAGTNDGCLVELNGTALQDLLAAAPASVGPGSYNRLFIETCQEEGQYTAYLTASVELDGTMYYTKTGGSLTSTAPAEPVGIVYAGCGRTYDLPQAVTVSDSAGVSLTLKMYFDIRDISWAALGTPETANAWLPGGCAGPRPANAGDPPFICTGYPDVSGLVDSLPPVLERYRINGGATVGLFFTPDGVTPIGGFTRRYFTEGVVADPGFNADTPIRDITPNFDGSYAVSSFGGGPHGEDAYFSAPAFRREDHSGTFSASGGAPQSYTAVKLEP